jgi:protein-S-isoprenylcysteine O-methyltransferase Ste14
MLPSRRGRGYLERTFVRVVATGGIVGISVAIAAIMSSSNSAGWIIGLVVSLVSVVLAALLWSSRVL